MKRELTLRQDTIRREQDLQRRLGHAGGLSSAAMDAAEALIAQLLQRDDPFEYPEILREIDAGLRHETVTDQKAAKGLGASSKITAADVLARLK